MKSNSITNDHVRNSSNFLYITNENHIKSNISNEYLKLYSIKEKAELSLAMGIPSENDGLIKYLKPSNICIDINRMEINYHKNCLLRIRNNTSYNNYDDIMNKTEYDNYNISKS